MNEEHAEKVYMIREVTAIQKLNMDVRRRETASPRSKAATSL